MEKSQLEILLEQASAADSAHHHALRQMNGAINEAEWAAKRNIERFFQGIYGANVERLHAIKHEADLLVEAERERVALTGTTAKYPLGTKMFKMVGSRSWDQKKVYGVVEAITRTSEHPDNLLNSRYPAVAMVGTIVVRYLKADGTPSKRYDFSMSQWKVADETASAA